MAASQVATAGTGFLTAIAIARLLGPDGIGDYTIALWLLTLMGAVMSLGLEQGLAWSVSAGRWAPRSAFVQSQLAALALGLIGAAIAVGVRLVAPGAFGGLSVVLVLLTAAAVPFLLSFSYSRWLAVTADRYEAFVAPLPLVSTLTLVLAAGLAIPWEETGMVVGLLAANVITAAVAFVTAARGLPPKAAAPPDDRGLQPLRDATKFGVRANVGTALQFINYRIDLFVLSAVTSSAQLGLYAAAVSVTSVMFLAPQTLAQVVFPRVAALSEGGAADPEHRAMVESKSIRHASLICLLSLPAVAGVTAIFLPLVYGSRFSGAIGYGMVLLPGVAMFGIASVLAATINGRGHPEYSLRTALISTPPSLVLYAVLIPLFEGWGAAIASTASYGLNLAVTAVYYRRATGDRVLPLLVPTRSELADLRDLFVRPPRPES